MTVLIVGLGLIGGSFAKAIKARTPHRVLGCERDPAVLSRALECGAIDGAGGAGDAELALIALYPLQTVAFIKENADRFRPGCVVIDLCGVKRFVCDGVRGFLPPGVTFIGGHPMAGRERFGFDSSLANLFDGASMILTPEDGAAPDSLNLAESFFRSVGFGHIEITSPYHHDEMIAYTSQLAHIVSSAYVKHPQARGYMGFSAGSFGDMTRVAKLNEEMWTELFLRNGDFLKNQIQVIIENLTDFRDAIASADAEALMALLREGREIKEALLEREK